MSGRSDAERKLAGVRARDSRLKAAGEKMARGLSKAAEHGSSRARAARGARKSAA